MTLPDNERIWPALGDMFFLEGKSETSFHLPSISIHFSPHANAFVQAADKVIEAHFVGIDRLGHEDHLFFPVVYLYRHALEIALKDTIHCALRAKQFSAETRLKLLGDKKRKGFLSKHGLFPLWECLHEVVAKIDDGTLKEPAEAFESMIKELHSVDGDGQTLRYNRDNQGNRNQDKLGSIPEFVDIANLRIRMQQMLNFLGGIDHAMDQIIEFQNGI